MDKTKNNEIVITFAKLRDNLMRYWWIMVAGFLIAVITIVWLDGRQETKGTDSICAELLFYFEEKEIEITEGETDSQLLTEMIKNKGENINYSELSAMAVEVMKTQTTIKEVNEKMNEAGFENYQFNVNQVMLTAANKLLICSIEGKEAREVLTLSQVYSDILIDKMRLLVKDETLVLLQEADEESLIVSKMGDYSGEILSVKNVFILCLTLLGAFLIVFVLTLMDRYIRNKDEVEQLKKTPVLGTVKNKRKGEWITDFILPEYLKNKGYDNVVLTTVAGKKIKSEFMNEICSYCSEQTGKTVKNVNGLKREIVQLEREDKIILVISINDDYIQDVEKVIDRLKLLDKNIIGVMYVYS